MFQKIFELQKQGQFAVLVTVVNVKGSAPREPGAKMLVTDTQMFGSIGGGNLEWIALEKAREILQTQKNQKMPVPLCSKVQQCCGGFVELFFDLVRPMPQLFIFGAGHVAQALLETLNGTDFHCTLIDERSEWIEKSQVFSQVTAICQNPLVWLKSQGPRFFENQYALVMTHDHHLDQDLIEILCQLPLSYAGLIGSQTKKQRFLKRLQDRQVPAQNLAKITCPIGLPIGGKAPKEVAISIAAELVKILHSEDQKHEIHSLSSGEIHSHGTEQSLS